MPWLSLPVMLPLQDLVRARCGGHDTIQAAGAHQHIFTGRNGDPAAHGAAPIAGGRRMFPALQLAMDWLDDAEVV